MKDLLSTYRDGLLRDTLPFWFPRCVDTEWGGFFTALDRDGTVMDTDKSLWQQGRITWLLSTLYTTVEPRPEWLAWAKHGVDFIRRHGFDTDGRMFFQVTREGLPLRKRRYVYSEAFACMAMAAYAKAAGDDKAAHQANALFRAFLRYTTTPGLLPPKGIPETRAMKSIGYPMIALGIAQVLRAAGGDVAHCTAVIDQSIAEIRDDFVKPEMECVLETTGPRGEFIDHAGGRTLNPGHAIEAVHPP
jgi:N-acylglucosamine 2-epimerase